VKALHGASGRVVRAELDDGRQLMCDLVLVGIGVIPNTELAAGCGLSVQGGILVDAHARTSDPAIFAAGDCAAFVSPWLPEGFPACRIESVQNANEMARAAASAIAGEARPYISLPWFWSDQHDVKLQMAGLNTGWTEHAVRGSVSARKFSFYYFREGRLIAVDSINRPQDHMLARKLLASGTQPSVQQVSDEGFDLARLIETRR
jgi:3-phenylpropionate/trans-cinnamate dioxygenase ferredoxin reductase subunit